MPANSTSPLLGFISVIEFESEYIGGLLVLNQSGRPLEFHCTGPVKPTRSHEVLFGKTLKNYILADNIAPALIKNVKQRPELFCTDCFEMTGVDPNSACVVYIETAATDVSDSSPVKRQHLGIVPEIVDEHQDPNLNSLGNLSWESAGQVVQILEGQRESKREIETILSMFTEQIELTEPFERIHNAIRESHGIKETRSSDAA